MSDATAKRSVPFFLSSFSWNFALGMTYPLVPLYRQPAGYVGRATLVALPVLVQIGFQSDRRRLHRPDGDAA